MQNNEYIELPPSPSSSIGGLREIGYTINTAIADIIDNSITAKAKNIWINFNWQDDKSYISILDDGIGMDQEVLKMAMRPGSKNPDDIRSPNDLGRFSLGLKTASWSQADKLYVWSKTKESDINSLGWDIEEVQEKDKWLVKTKLPESSELDSLKSINSGTLIEWQNLKLVTQSDTNAEQASKEEFYAVVEDVKKYISMIFHRFVEGKASKNQYEYKLNLYVNNNLLHPWDPFFASETVLNQVTPEEELPFKDDVIFVKGYVLPHKESLTEKEYESAGGREDWLKHQGFFVYRSDRLIVPGDWLGLGRGGKKWQDEEQYRLARICIDIPNSMDKDWSLDLKKALTIPPRMLREKLMRHAEKVRADARQAFVKRGKYGPKPKREYFDNVRVWSNKKRNEKTIYRINFDHPRIKEFQKSIGPNAKDFKNIIRLIEECVPVQQMWIDSAEGDIAVPFDGVEEELKEQIKELFNVFIKTMDRKKALDKIKMSEPYNRYPEIIEEVLEDE